MLFIAIVIAKKLSRKNNVRVSIFSDGREKVLLLFAESSGRRAVGRLCCGRKAAVLHDLRQTVHRQGRRVVRRVEPLVRGAADAAAAAKLVGAIAVFSRIPHEFPVRLFRVFTHGLVRIDARVRAVVIHAIVFLVVTARHGDAGAVGAAAAGGGWRQCRGLPVAGC